MVGKDDFAFIPQLAAKFYADEARIFQSGLPLLGQEASIIGPDGKVVWLAITKVPLRNLQGAIIGLVGINRDISAQKQRERQLRYYASLQENVSDAVITADLNFRIQSWNRAAETIYGWRAEEVLGRRVRECLPSHYLSSEESDEHARQILFEQGQWQGEIVHRRKDGAELSMLSSITLLKDEEGKPFGMVALNHDITERKRVGEELQAQRDFLQLVIDSVPDIVLVKDDTGRFQLVNVPAAQIYGLTPAAMLGKTDAEINPNPAEVTFFRQKDQETLDSEQIVFIPEHTILGRHYQTSKIPLKNATGHADRLLVVSLDITEHKQVEAVLQQALHKEQELRELKSRFFSIASHELRNPLTSIILMSETLNVYRHKLTETQIEQRLSGIQTQAHHLKEIMEDVLQMAELEARRHEFNPVRLDLNLLCRNVLAEFQGQLDGVNRLLYTCDDSPAEVSLDKKLMRQILTNLVSNAMKYSPVGKPIRVRLMHTADAAVIQVQDEGIGIPEADLKYLFEPFHRASNVGKVVGTGLGLTIVKEAVERHGGTITVESLSGVGTTFTVHIPFLPNEPSALHPN